MSHSLFSSPHLSMVQRILEEAKAQGRSLYVVGGMVRDFLRGASLTDPDLDIVVEGNALEFASQVHPALGGTLKRFPDFLTAKILSPGDGTAFAELDFASTRTERYESPGALPSIALASLSDDLRRRDFSINAMAVTLTDFIRYVQGECPRDAVPVVDLFNGCDDLRTRTIRILHPRSFIDDPTRLFRACRYLARLGGSLETGTELLLGEAVQAGAVDTVSRFRVATEIKKLFLDDAAPDAVLAAERLGLLAASKIVPAEGTSKLSAVLRNPPEVISRGSNQDKFGFLLLSLCALGGLVAIEHFGLSKRRLQEIETEVERVSKVPSESLSATELAIRGLIYPEAHGGIDLELAQSKRRS